MFSETYFSVLFSCNTKICDQEVDFILFPVPWKQNLEILRSNCKIRQCCLACFLPEMFSEMHFSALFSCNTIICQQEGGATLCPVL